MEVKDEGICRFCRNTFSGRAMGRHLSACKVKKQQDEQDAKGKNRTMIYHLKIAAYKPYWLHIEMEAAATFTQLDQFLRKIWLECCGHLSEFTINGVEYAAEGEIDYGWGMESRSMNTQLKKVLHVKDTFEYQYDFGSTTYLTGQVFAQRQGYLNDRIRILARNAAPQFQCTGCSALAKHICTDCEDFYCDTCLDKHSCGDEMALPVVNSPRMGVCGYAGEGDFDDFRVET